MCQSVVRVTVLCQGILVNRLRTLRQRDAGQRRHIVEHGIAHHVVLRIPRTIIGVLLCRSVGRDFPLVVAVATCYDTGVGQVQHLQVGQIAVQIVDVGTVNRSLDGQLQHVVGVALRLYLAT